MSQIIYIHLQIYVHPNLFILIHKMFPCVIDGNELCITDWNRIWLKILWSMCRSSFIGEITVSQPNPALTHLDTSDLALHCNHHGTGL